MADFPASFGPTVDMFLPCPLRDVQIAFLQPLWREGGLAEAKR
ncbi:MAG: hypothetical protein AB7F98_11355 [Novosphingobium sp.]